MLPAWDGPSGSSEVAAKAMAEIMAEVGAPFSADFAEAPPTSLDICAPLTDYIELLDLADQLFAPALERNGAPQAVWREAVSDCRRRFSLSEVPPREATPRRP